MEKIGFIGCGHIGSVLLQGFLDTGALTPAEISISTRSPHKLDSLQRAYPTLHIAADNCAAALESSLLFLCVTTGQAHPVLTEIGPSLGASTHLVTVCGGLEIASIEKVFSGPVTKIMPTLIARVREGVTLVCHNSQVSAAQQARLSHLLGKIGLVREIREAQFEAAADLTSCAPGLLACLYREFARAGARHSDLTRQEAADMLLRTVYGTARLLLETGEGFDDLVSRVATPGGATEGGASVLEARLPTIFDEMFAATLERHERRKQATRQQFGLP